MPRPKKARLIDASSEAPRRSRRIAGRPGATFDELGVDVIAIIFGFLGPFDIMRSRLCRKLRKAATTTTVPPTNFTVNSVQKHNAMRAMATALPNLQEINLHDMEYGHRFVDGEDPDESMTAATANETIHDINIITNFRKLRELHVHTNSSMNGRYPFLFNFQLLQKFTMFGCFNLKWDLSMLEGLPLLKELHCYNNNFLTGNINSLRELKDTLEKVIISLCPDVEGNFNDLADFPRLVKLELSLTSVSGDIRKIGETDFLKLEHLGLPDTVCGGREYEFHRISDVPEVMHSIHHLRKRVLGFAEGWTWSLSELSPDFYHFDNPRASDLDDVPFFVAMVQVGSRLGWRWENDASDQHCEMNWLDPEPEKESSDYEEYTLELQAMQEKIDLYRGFQQPPTEAEYNRIQNMRGLY